MSDAIKIDVYPVGALREIQVAWRVFVTRRKLLPDIARTHTRRNLVRFLKVHVVRNIRQRHWRQLKNMFNGYLAEPTPFPEHVTRCGSGWTKRRALRSLEHYMGGLNE